MRLKKYNDFQKLNERVHVSVPNDHPDFQIMKDVLKEYGIEIESPFNYREDLPQRIVNLRSFSSVNLEKEVTEGNYIRVNNLRYWSEDMISKLIQAFGDINDQTEDYLFIYFGVDDYELEPGERSWPASFKFTAINK